MNDSAVYTDFIARLDVRIVAKFRVSTSFALSNVTKVMSRQDASLSVLKFAAAGSSRQCPPL